jgi:hypothetical protein
MISLVANYKASLIANRALTIDSQEDSIVTAAGQLAMSDGR